MSKPKEISIVNKKAHHNFFIAESWEAGMVLTGTEVKSIRNGKANLTDSFCYLKSDELWVKNLHISAYEHSGYFDHDPKRDRKLLLNRREITKIQSKTKEKGITIVPIRIYENERSLLKIEIGLARGKKLFDKRETLKENESKRDIERALKNY